MKVKLTKCAPSLHSFKHGDVFRYDTNIYMVTNPMHEPACGETTAVRLSTGNECRFPTNTSVERIEGTFVEGE